MDQCFILILNIDPLKDFDAAKQKQSWEKIKYKKAEIRRFGTLLQVFVLVSGANGE